MGLLHENAFNGVYRMRFAEGMSFACSLTSNILQQGRFNWLRVIFGKGGNAKPTVGGSRFIVDDLHWEAKMEKKAQLYL